MTQSDDEKVEVLNQFFTSVFTAEDLENIPELENKYTGKDPLEEVEITLEKVKKKLMLLRPNKSPGPDRFYP